MRLRLPLAIILLVAIIFTGCNRASVTLDYTNAKEQVPTLGNLVFRFNKGLVPDSLLNIWDSSAYISFTPAIAGRFRWEHPDELVFSPLRPLPPATSFKAVFNSDLFEYSKYSRVDREGDLAFHTADLQMEEVNNTWVLQDEQSRVILPQLDVYFNYPVEPAGLKEKLHIEVDGKPAAFNILTAAADDQVSIRLLNVKAEDRNYDARITLDKGILPVGGTNGSKDVAVLSASLSSPFLLAINDVSAEHDGTTGRVSVKTSQQVSDVDIAKFISIKPAIKFTVEKSADGFLLTSDQLDASKVYELTVAIGLRGKIGGVLREEYNSNLAFGDLEPSISFGNSKAVYLSAAGEKNIEVRITNVPKAKLVISKIYENNLLSAQRYGYYPKESRGGGGYEMDEQSGDVGESTPGDVIYEKELNVRSLPKFGNSRLFHFNIEDLLPEFKGIYHISIRSDKDYWVRDSRFISLSDIGLIGKEGVDRMHIFANSIKTAAPLGGLNLFVYGNNNQLLGTGTTNEQGIAEVGYARKEFAGFRPALVIAKSVNDFNYLPLATTKTNTSRFDAGGKQSNATGLDAFIYAERDIYRPGESVNFAVVIRNGQWLPPGDLPIKLKFLMPNGKEMKLFRKTLNAQGALEGSVDIPESSITGSYSLEVYSSNDILLSEKPFMIEEFVPDRIKVTAVLDKPFLTTGDATTLNINAVNFFGPPAANRNYETEIQVKQKTFNSVKHNQYDFNLANQQSFFDKLLKEGKTDDKGNASEPYQVPSTYSNMGLLQTTFYTTVFDETGRPVSRVVSADIFTQPVFLGLAKDEYGYYALSQPVQFPIVAVDRNDQLVNGFKAAVRVIKHEYRTVLTKSGGYFRYDSQKQDKEVAGNTIIVSGEKTLFSFVPRSPGEYEIRVALPGSGNYVSRSFYSYGNWGGENNSFEVNNEGSVDISTDKASYLSGETARVLFKTPFSGKMLVTMESDKVLFNQYVDVDKRSATIDLKLTEAYIPNIYITATLIKAHGVSDIPLTVAHGLQPVKVEEKSRRIAVEIAASKSVRSRTHQKVTVKATPGSLVTLAAVDNGVLQVSDFKTPDPYNYFYARRALEVNNYDIYPLLFPELRARLSSTGGDGDLETGKRSNPMPAKRIKILSYWSGMVTANANGQANFEFDVPAFSGQIRLMAVACNNKQFGSAELAMTVADPLVLSTALPRFLSPGDTVSVPVNISNTTNRDAAVTARLQLSGPLKISGTASQTLSLAGNSEGRAVFQVIASAVAGIGKVRVEVNGLGETFRDEIDMSIRPAAGWQKLTGAGSIAGQGIQRITIPVSDFMASTASYKLIVGRSPTLQVAGQLNYLLQYPYGCTEQVVSAAFPLLYAEQVPELTKTVSMGPGSSGVQEAIRKISSRQLYNGGLMLWDDEGTENWWLTVYAAHFLLEARKVGYAVDPSLIETTLAFVSNKLKKKSTISYFYNRTLQKKIAPKEVAYSLFVLALAGIPDISVMNYYKSNQSLMSLDSRYLLSATYALAGDKSSFRGLLPPSFSGEESVAETGGSFYSDIRDEAIALDVLAEVDPGNAQVPVMARHVMDKLRQRRWYNTQEAAFSFIALGKLSRAASRSTITADVSVNGKAIGRVDKSVVQFSTKQLNGTNIDINTKGEGRLYYWWQSEGLSASGKYVEEDNFIKVRRRFFDRNGKALSSNTFNQNDLVVVQVTLEKSYAGSIENIVITDILPAGFEVENARTKEVPGMEWIKDAATPTQVDVRDDRVNLFVDLRSSRQTYYYAVRAVSTGIYHMGPVSADAMYNGEYHSYNGGGVVRVK